MCFNFRPYIERANQASPTHSRLDKSAILFVDPARPLPRTPKGTIPRSAAIKLYAQDIDRMYASLEKGSEVVNEVLPSKSWGDLAAVESWLSICVANILGRNVDVEGDLFQQGMDRLV